MIEFYIDYKKVEKPLKLKDVDVEIGFGKGDFLVKKALENPSKTFIGFEISIVSLNNLYKRIKKHGVKNVYYTKIDAVVGFQVLFKDSSVENIYINYPDPFPKKRDVKRRITRPYALYTFAKKLKEGGSITLRTDHKEFLEFTLESLSEFNCFDYHYKKLNVKSPLTKYEERWLLEGKELFEVVIKKVKEPEEKNFYQFKEVKLYPLKVEEFSPKFENIVRKEFRIDENIAVRFLDLAKKEGKEVYFVETILSENGFLQRFFLRVRNKNGGTIIDVSPFSEILLTEGVKRVVQFAYEKLKAV